MALSKVSGAFVDLSNGQHGCSQRSASALPTACTSVIPFPLAEDLCEADDIFIDPHRPLPVFPRIQAKPHSHAATDVGKQLLSPRRVRATRVKTSRGAAPEPSPTPLEAFNAVVRRAISYRLSNADPGIDSGTVPPTFCHPPTATNNPDGPPDTPRSSSLPEPIPRLARSPSSGNDGNGGKTNMAILLLRRQARGPPLARRATPKHPVYRDAEVQYAGTGLHLRWSHKCHSPSPLTQLIESSVDPGFLCIRLIMHYQMPLQWGSHAVEVFQRGSYLPMRYKCKHRVASQEALSRVCFRAYSMTMDLSESLSKLTEQANSLKSGFQPVLRRRKAAAPGTSVFTTTALADNHEPLAPHADPPTHTHAPNSFSVASGFQFRPPVTPISIHAHLVSRHSAADFPLPSTVHPSTPMPHDDSQQSFELPEPSPHLHDGELDGLNPDHTPFRRRRTTDAYTKIHNYLAVLRTDRISPLDLLIQLSKLLETIIADPQGRTKLLDCMRPHVVEFAREIVAEEMEVRWQKSILSGIAAVSPDFVQNWNLEESDTAP
ncbi:hypothetical protein B0H13DRAFT_2270878 [Mycena leptocephala]|nr:hypothetical protein B0H13DRAFT_2270878 [Mycena leptocephala]